MTRSVAGRDGSCALTAAGGVKCWGYNEFGQLGTTTNNATANANPAPADVPSLTSGVVVIAAGGYHTCALTTAGGGERWGVKKYRPGGAPEGKGDWKPRPPAPEKKGPTRGRGGGGGGREQPRGRTKDG